MKTFKTIIYYILVIIPAVLFFPFLFISAIGDMGKEACQDMVDWLKSIFRTYEK